MKIKVAFHPLGGEDTTVTMEISQGTIADIAKSGCITDIVNEAFAKSGGPYAIRIREKNKK